MELEALYEGRLAKARECGCNCGARPGAAAGGAGACRPYMKIEKDQPKFLACQRIADELGPVTASSKAFRILREAVGSEVAERFGVLTLDTHLKLRGLWETGAGETDSVMAPKVPTLQAAIVDDAAAAVIYHVHPAASDYPSEADVEVTRGFNAAFLEVGILLMDHIIVAVGSPKGFYSFADSMPDVVDFERALKRAAAPDLADFKRPQDAVGASVDRYGATHLVILERERQLYVYSPADRGYLRREVYLHRGLWHVGQPTRVARLPGGAQAIPKG